MSDGLGVPVHPIDQMLLKIVVAIEKFFRPDALSDLKGSHFRRFATHVVELLISKELGGRRPQFRIPTHLQDAWELAKN